jgi:hypothetical protein
MGRRFARWLELKSGERWLLLGLMIALPVIAALLRVFGLVRTRHWLEWSSGNAATRNANSDDLQSAERLARLTDIAGRRGALTATCLRQSLLIYWRLRRRGFAPELKIGVRKEEAAFDAHAWVELSGIALGQTELAHSPFPDRDWNAQAPLL